MGLVRELATAALEAAVRVGLQVVEPGGAPLLAPVAGDDGDSLGEVDADDRDHVGLAALAAGGGQKHDG
ncbi:hypothetical protein D3C83_237910 [compost metagenome]